MAKRKLKQWVRDDCKIEQPKPAAKSKKKKGADSADKEGEE